MDKYDVITLPSGAVVKVPLQNHAKIETPKKTIEERLNEQDAKLDLIITQLESVVHKAESENQLIKAGSVK